MKKQVSRRNLFKAGLGTLGTLAGGKALANVCGVQTGEQPLGPFFPNEGTPRDEIRETDGGPISLANDHDLTHVNGRNGRALGQQVVVRGIVRDVNCQPIPDATLVIWQASASGRYNHKGDAANVDFQDPRDGSMVQRTHDPNFQYWGRATSNENGAYHFRTVIPGFYPANLQSGWFRPPHIHFMVSATGHQQFVTQMYFGGNHLPDKEWIEELNSRDPLLQNPNLTAQQKQQLVVHFIPEFDVVSTLGGKFDINLED